MENIRYSQLFYLFAETSLQIGRLSDRTEQQLKSLAEKTDKQISEFATQAGDFTNISSFCFSLFLFSFALSAKAQVVAITAMRNGKTTPFKNAVIRCIPADKKREEWVALTDSTGTKRLLAQEGDTIAVYSRFALPKTIVVQKGKWQDTVLFDQTSDGLYRFLPPEMPPSFLPKVKLVDFEAQQKVELLYFLGQYFADKAPETLTNEQAWLGYWYNLKKEIEEDGVLLYYKNMQQSASRQNTLYTLLATNTHIPDFEGNGLQQTLLYGEMMHRKYKTVIADYNKAHNGFWNAEFKQTLAELASTEQEILVVLPAFESALLNDVQAHFERFCTFD
ncbi:MAG: hypothetical protein RI894_2034 [Bacteroidota bacterium]|jgi:hypothetical protein